MRTRRPAPLSTPLAPLAAAALLALAPAAEAASRYWTFIGGCAAADWFGVTSAPNSEGQFTCWSTSSGGGSGAPAPTSLDDVFIVQPGATLPLLVSFAAPTRGPAPFGAANSLTMYGSSSFAAGMTMDRGTLLLNTMTLGAAGLPFIGQFDQSGSAVVTALGSVNVLAGQYNLNGGTLGAPGLLSIRAQGVAASFNQRGGSLVAGRVEIGSEQGGAASFSQLAGSAVSTLLDVGIVPGQGSAVLTLAGGTWTNSGSATIGGTGQGRLDLGAGRLSTGSLAVGLLPGGNGTVDVQSAAATLEVAGQITLGGTGGVAAMRVTGGAQVTGGSALVDYAPSGTDSQALLLQGAGSRLTLREGFTMGVLGDGSAAVTEGALLASQTGTLGAERGHSGALRVSGAGSGWTVGGGLVVGARASGRLTIEDGAALSSGSAVLGNERLSIGRVTVAGGTWQNLGLLTVGKAGTGTLSVRGGGQVATRSLTLGDTADGRGTVELQGQGSALLSDAPLVVGRAGRGELTLGRGTTLGAASAVFGEQAGGSGRASLAGTLALADQAVVGLDGSGELSITGGGLLTSGSGVIGKGSGNGSVDLGAAQGQARWTMAGPLDLGRGAGSGKLVLRSGGRVDVGDLTTIGRRGAVVLDGGTLATGALKVLDGGSLSWTSGQLSVTGSGGLALGSNGIPLRWDLGPNRQLQVSAALTVGQGAELRVDGGQLAAGRLALGGGSVRLAPGQVLDNVGQIDGQGRVDGAIGGSGKIIVSAGELRLGTLQSGDGFAYRGQITVGPGTLRIDDADLAEVGSTTLLQSGGRIATTNGLLIGPRQALYGVDQGATVEGRLVNQGQVGIEGGSLTLTGLVGGAGNFAGRVQFDAGYTPGDEAVASIAFNGGTAVFGSGATLTMQIDGVSPRTGYDRLQGLFAMEFGGTLVLDFGDSFQTRTTASLALWDTSRFTGSLDASHIVISGIDAARVDTSKLASDGLLLVAGTSAAVAPVPEPGTLALWAAGLGVMGWRARARYAAGAASKP